MSSSPICVKETPTIDQSECIDTAMPSQPVLKGCATPVVLPGEGKNPQHSSCSSSFATQVYAFTKYNISESSIDIPPIFCVLIVHIVVLDICNIVRFQP